jgi:hypothetical protein
VINKDSGVQGKIENKALLTVYGKIALSRNLGKPSRLRDLLSFSSVKHGAKEKLNADRAAIVAIAVNAMVVTLSIGSNNSF